MIEVAVTEDGALLPSLREGHRASTRERIVRAAADLLVREHPATIAMPEIARRAGVSLATLYRYFPNKEALFDAITALTDRRSREWVQQRGITLENVSAYLTRLWSELVGELPLIRAQHDSPGGREIRRKRRDARLGVVADALRTGGIDVESEGGRRLLALSALLCGSAALLELHDHLDLSAETAAQYAAWAIQTLAAHTRTEQGQAMEERQP